MSNSAAFLSEVQDVLEDNILSYWLTLKDPRGGFYGEVSGTGSVDKDAVRGVVQNARIIWAFSAAYRKIRKKEYLLAATHAKDFFLEHFVDHKYGGVYWTVDKDGARVDTKAQLYAQAFAIYALSEYYKASKDDQSLKAACNLYKIVRKHFLDPANGGYIEALTRDFRPVLDKSLSDKDINAEKTMNSHLHLLEAFANLYSVWPDEGLKVAVSDLIAIMTDKIQGPDGHLRLYFDSEWNVLPGGKSYGHDIETSWLILECAFMLKDFDIIGKVRPAALKMGLASLEGLQGDGSMIHETRADGTDDTSREWWVEAESVVGHLWMWKYLGVAEGAGRALAQWEYIKSHLIDRKGGEWYWSADASGVPDTSAPKAGEWKCPYHNTRMCLEVLDIFS